MALEPVEKYLPLYKSKLENKIRKSTLKNYVSCVKQLWEVDLLDPERLSSEMNESIEYYHTNKNSAGTKYSAF